MGLLWWILEASQDIATDFNRLFRVSHFSRQETFPELSILPFPGAEFHFVGSNVKLQIMKNSLFLMEKQLRKKTASIYHNQVNKSPIHQNSIATSNTMKASFPSHYLTLLTLAPSPWFFFNIIETSSFAFPYLFNIATTLKIAG